MQLFVLKYLQTLVVNQQWRDMCSYETMQWLLNMSCLLNNSLSGKFSVA